MPKQRLRRCIGLILFCIVLLGGLIHFANAGIIERTQNEEIVIANDDAPEMNSNETLKIRQQFEENNWWNDFEVHFFVSLPFTALYSYLTTVSLDSIVQGKFPPEFHQANVWMIIGLAVGGSAAIALGSQGRVADQSIYKISAEEIRLDGMSKEIKANQEADLFTLEFVRVHY